MLLSQPNQLRVGSPFGDGEPTGRVSARLQRDFIDEPNPYMLGETRRINCCVIQMRSDSPWHPRLKTYPLGFWSLPSLCRQNGLIGDDSSRYKLHGEVSSLGYTYTHQGFHNNSRDPNLPAANRCHQLRGLRRGPSDKSPYSFLVAYAE